ncbi:MAG: hypothetical protein AVDCRST_MAG38-1126 [uncultured Solirubrobacteraceae bacterium]|uniref:Uncharacterized protein n=1 Tax=uncultured Solirubrobacteraceae bacterium TaxID=1162706 RepID=A0A6J4RHL6_9ACTN|nr:MAG: hypothetical protein AVDCRST_MAG38-1126 [uncultured Solirubrobacteraceae bacterium]
MTETPELEKVKAAAEPSSHKPDRRPSPPEAQPIPESAEADYLGADGEVIDGSERAPCC